MEKNQKTIKCAKHREMKNYTNIHSTMLLFPQHNIFNFPSSHSSKRWTRHLRIISIGLLDVFTCFTHFFFDRQAPEPYTETTIEFLPFGSRF